MHRAGLLPIPRVDIGLRSVLATRRYGPFVGAMRNALEQTPDAIAIIDEKGPVTYAELDLQSNALAHAWLSYGLRSGSVIAALCRDHRGLVLTMLAAGKIGARLVLMNTGFARPQLADVARRERVEAIVYDEEFTEILGDIPESVTRYVSWRESRDKSARLTTSIDDLVHFRRSSRVPTPSSPGGFVLLTSGTTGTPKGAPRDRTSIFATAQFLDRIPLRQGGTTFMAAPIFHGTGLSQFVLSLALGCTVVLNRKFDPEKTLAAIEHFGVDVLIVVPTMLQRILDLDDDVLHRYNTSSVRIIFAAGSSLSPDLCRRTAARFGDVLYNLYGSTEVAVATVATPAELRRAPGTAGRPPITCKVALFDDDGARIDNPDVTGRIFVGSGLSFEGYTDGRNKEILDGLLSSGDIGHFNSEGLLFVDGRDDDMVVSGGENVYPIEVENLLIDRPDVRDAAVVGVADVEFGHRLRAFVVSDQPLSGDAARERADEIRDYVRRNLARYKTPRDVIFIDELPRNATGKLLRRELEKWDK
ncbi:acyl-CoA synthetase [Hoyosella rhizosphaerae]|nr:acyl-CoA synthetase [Hoyosella rhizosphaerae]